MSGLELCFLGAPEVWKGDRLLKFPTRKSLALLIYLAVGGGWHSREKLVALLWPESAPPQGQASLRNALIRLRRTLGEAETHLLIEGELLSFDLNPILPPPPSEGEPQGLPPPPLKGGSRGGSLDLSAITMAIESSDPAALQQAVERYRGDFLEGFTLPDAPAFDEWASLQREFWHRQMSEILARLSQLQAEGGQFHQGLATARRWTAHDPLNEAAHRRLIELHLIAGDRTAALQAYENCRTLLAAELAAEPSPETNTLVERIKNSGISNPDPGAARINPKSKTRTELVERIQNPKSFELPLVGRSIKHLQLVTAFHAVRHAAASPRGGALRASAGSEGGLGQPQLVVISGEAGIGKTRLATEFLAWAAANGADLLQGRAFEAGGRLPYQPLVEALGRRLEQENAPEDLLSDLWLAQLSRLLPELRERYPDLPLPVENENEARLHLLQAVARLGQALAERQKPVVIFIDDIQWADLASLDMLRYCSRSWAEAASPILLLLTLRSEAIAVDASLQEWLAGLERDITSHHLSLEALTLADTRQLAHALVDREDGAALAIAQRFGDWLFAETEGQPFFVSETIKELVNQGILRTRPGQAALWKIELAALETLATGASRLPKGVRQLITTRLSRLTPAASALLTAAAVLGRPCSYTRLSQVAALDELAGLSGLDELLNAHLLIETDNAGRPYTIAHDKIRGLVYDEAGVARRRIFHRRAFEALEIASARQPESGQRAAELAYHALSARLTEPAFRYSQAAGDHALALFALQDAITYYEQARTLIPDPPLPAATSLLLNLGRAYELAGDLKQAGTIYQALLQQVQSQPDLTCTVLNRLATVAVYSYDFELAISYLQQAKGIAEENENKAGLAETEWSLAQLYHHQFDFQRSLVHSQRTLTLACGLGDERLIASSLNALAYAQMLLGQVSAGEATMSEARALYAALGNKALEADCLTAIAAAQIWQGRPQQGVETAQAAEAICAEIANPWGHIYSRVWLVTGLLDTGNYEAALAVGRAGQDQANAHQLLPMSLFIKLVLGKVYKALGQPELAYQLDLEAMTLNEQLNSKDHLTWIMAELCTDCALMGNWAEAATYARKTLAHRNYTALPLVIPACWPEIAALLRSGERRLAQAEVKHWESWISHIPRFRPGYLHALVLLAEAEGDLAQALDHLKEAYSLAEGIGLPEEKRELLMTLGKLYRASGEEGKAQQAFEEAGEVIQALAAGIGAEALRSGFLAAKGTQSRNIK